MTAAPFLSGASSKARHRAALTSAPRTLQLVQVDWQRRPLAFLKIEETFQFALSQYLGVLIHEEACQALGIPGQTLCEKPSKRILEGKPQPLLFHPLLDLPEGLAALQRKVPTQAVVDGKVQLHLAHLSILILSGHGRQPAMELDNFSFVLLDGQPRAVVNLFLHRAITLIFVLFYTATDSTI